MKKLKKAFVLQAFLEVEYTLVGQQINLDTPRLYKAARLKVLKNMRPLVFRFLCSFFALSFFLFSYLSGNESIFLRDNLMKAKSGDFIVTAQNKNYTLLHIYNKQNDKMIIEEISVPASRVDLDTIDWRNWVLKGAPGSTSWILFVINLNTPSPYRYFSVKKNAYFEMPERENFLATLLNLRLEHVPLKDRKKIGISIIPNAESRQVWNPQLIVNGVAVPGAAFDAWKIKWPQDGSEMAGKVVEAYTPEDPQYPSYFPYWLQISGVVGNAKVRVIDSGNGLISPTSPHVFDISH